MSYEYVYTPESVDPDLFQIRDMKDYPVLYTAIIEDVDVLIPISFLRCFILSPVVMFITS